jgi:hypothetical protein
MPAPTHPSPHPTPPHPPPSINPFLAGNYNPVLALDVFLVQAATNTLLGHFLSLLCSLWLLNVISEGRGLRLQVGRAGRARRGPEAGAGRREPGGRG